MNHLRQVIFEMRHQPLMTWLSIFGTAIAIFLIMSDYMINNINMVNVAPESNRSRIVYGSCGEISNPERNNSSSSYLSYELARELYSSLDGVEKFSLSSQDASTRNISVKGGIPENGMVRCTDVTYWSIYDYDFLEGAPFTNEEFEAGVPVAIITRKTAEHYFGKEETYLGKEILIANKPYKICGIISDVNPLMNNTTADIFISTEADGMPKRSWVNGYLGEYMAILLLKKDTDIKYIKQQVENRYKTFNKRHEKENVILIYHNQPWTNEEKNSGSGSNTTPDLTMQHRTRLISYIILLIIPAINLSSMTRSRMRRRVSEIGLLRAFGCTRSRIVFNFLTENFIITLFGGILGVILSMIFITAFSNYFINYNGFMICSIEQTLARPTFQMLFSWKSFGAVMIFCFILNMLSAGIPAMKAAFTNPAEAIQGNNVHK